MFPRLNGDQSRTKAPPSDTGLLSKLDTGTAPLQAGLWLRVGGYGDSGQLKELAFTTKRVVGPAAPVKLRND
jgi:hypothetical protein